MQILSRHTLIKYDWTLKFFLTCENSDDFERLKNDPKEFAPSSSIAVTALKDFRIKDTINYLYSSIKSKLVKDQEPEEIKTDLELDEINEKISKYINFLEKSIVVITSKVLYEKNRYEEQEQMVRAFEETQEDDPELEKTFRDVAEFYRKEMEVIKFCMEKDAKLLSDVKEEKSKQEGIKMAIAERKSVCSACFYLSLLPLLTSCLKFTLIQNRT